MYSDFNKSHFRKMLGALDQHFREISSGPLLAENAEGIAHSVLPQDDTAYQWSPLGSGVTSSQNLDRALESVFRRLVVHHEREATRTSRSDQQVWSKFRSAVRYRNRLAHLGSKKIATSDDVVEFGLAFKNGIWHCLKPLSFDLQNRKQICGKAHEWLGKMTSVAGTDEPFKVYFLIGEPARPAMKGACRQAIGILRKATVEKEIIVESRRDRFAEAIEPLLPETEVPIESGLFAKRPAAAG
jgi:hypothetical protein